MENWPFSVSDETLAEANRGRVVTVTGTATARVKGGQYGQIVAILPRRMIRITGTLKLRIIAGSRKMTFTPGAYHFACDTAGIGSGAAEWNQTLKIFMK